MDEPWRKLEGELAAGLYRPESRKLWKDFRAEYEAKIMSRLAMSTQQTIRDSIGPFARLVKPRKVTEIKTATIDDFVSRRRLERGRKPGSVVSPATVNRELRHLKAALRVAHEWSYLPVVPKFRMLREYEEIGPVITEEHFSAIYRACDAATRPSGLPCEPAEWWRAWLAFAITTGWRIEKLLAFRREDLDLETGAIITRAVANKGKRDDMDYLPEAALAHVKMVVSLKYAVLFHWPHWEKGVWGQFHDIQRAAGIKLPCHIQTEHKCTPSCHVYGFHALRRGYATMNADSMPAMVLQKKMRHRSITTTLRYVELSSKMKRATEAVHVPEAIRVAK